MNTLLHLGLCHTNLQVLEECSALWGQVSVSCMEHFHLTYQSYPQIFHSSSFWLLKVKLEVGKAKRLWYAGVVYGGVYNLSMCLPLLHCKPVSVVNFWWYYSGYQPGQGVRVEDNDQPRVWWIVAEHNPFTRKWLSWVWSLRGSAQNSSVYNLLGSIQALH